MSSITALGAAAEKEAPYSGGENLFMKETVFSRQSESLQQSMSRITAEELKKYQYIYEGKETYAFLLSDKMILSLYTLCMAERRELALARHEELYLSAVDRGMAKLENIREVLFQTLSLGADVRGCHRRQGRLKLLALKYFIKIFKNCLSESVEERSVIEYNII